MQVDKEYRLKLENLSRAKVLEELDQGEITDPLFMNIDMIAQLPMASKQPLKIHTSETLLSSTMASTTNQSDLQSTHLKMQTQLLDSVNERKT